MSDPIEKMVLRTVYLPPALDEKLRVQAFRSKVTKNDLIRRALERELSEVPEFGREPAKSERKLSTARKSRAAKPKSAA